MDVTNVDELANLTPEDISIAIRNRDYYTKPEDEQDFVQCMECLVPAVLESTDICEVPLEVGWITLGAQLVSCFFDKEYFEEQVMKNREPQPSKDQLKSYLGRLSLDDIDKYTCILINYKHSHRFFMRNCDFTAMRVEFNEMCRKIDNSVVSMESPYYSEFVEERGICYYDQYLDKETIIDVICKYISKNVIMAENVAETLYNCGAESAFQYPAMVLSIQQKNPNIKVLM
ncbi:MAG: hypothetical protein IJ309_04275 [Clostridia bacterium]|nr:hypothetical protein [Clostridia bacterium]